MTKQEITEIIEKRFEDDIKDIFYRIDVDMTIAKEIENAIETADLLLSQTDSDAGRIRSEMERLFGALSGHVAGGTVDNRMAIHYAFLHAARFLLTDRNWIRQQASESFATAAETTSSAAL